MAKTQIGLPAGLLKSPPSAGPETESDAASTFELGEGVEMEADALATAYGESFEALRIEQAKAEAVAKRLRALGHPVLKKPVEPPPAGLHESEEYSLIRRLVVSLTVRTQMGMLMPDQCLGCTTSHKIGQKMPVPCGCACHQARKWLKAHRAAQDVPRETSAA